MEEYGFFLCISQQMNQLLMISLLYGQKDYIKRLKLVSDLPACQSKFVRECTCIHLYSTKCSTVKFQI